MQVNAAGTIRIKGAIGLCVLAWAASAQAEAHLIPTLKIGAEERYDSDVSLKGTDAQGPGALITKLTPQIGLDVKDHTLTATTFYAADVYFRQAAGSSVPGQRGSGTLDFNHRGAIELKKATSRTTRIEAKFRIWRVSDPTALPRLGLARELDPILFGTAELIGEVRLTPRTTLRLGYLFEGVRVSNEPDRPDPAFLNAPYAEVWYRATRRSDVGAEYRFQYFTLGGGASADSQGAALAYRYHFSRHARLTARAGPVWYQDRTNRANSGWLPRAIVEFVRDLEHFAVAMVVGHDLTGVSGFSSAFWADYAALTASYRAAKDVSVFAGASYFRNGLAPNDGIDSFRPLAVHGSWQGYFVGGGVEWRPTRYLAVQGSLNRIDQVAGPTGGVDLSRNIAAVRVVLTAL